MAEIDPKIRHAIFDKNGESQKTGTRAGPTTRRQMLVTGGIATTVVMVRIPGTPEAQTPATVSTDPRKLKN